MSIVQKSQSFLLDFLQANKGRMAAVLVASVAFFAFLWFTHPKSLEFTIGSFGTKSVGKFLRGSIEQLARDVTIQMLDSSYNSYRTNAMTLLNRNGGELDPPLIRRLQQIQLLPKNDIELKKTEETLRQEKNVVTVSIDRVMTGNLTPQGLVPVDVDGQVAMHSASGDVPERNFHFRYIIGMRKIAGSSCAFGPPEAPMESVLVVADMQDLSGEPSPARLPDLNGQPDQPRGPD